MASITLTMMTAIDCGDGSDHDSEKNEADFASSLLIWPPVSEGDSGWEAGKFAEREAACAAHLATHQLVSCHLPFSSKLFKHRPQTQRRAGAFNAAVFRSNLGRAFAAQNRCRGA